MKKLICVLAVLLLMTGCALAEEYVTLAELREQAAQGWNETYQTKNGEQIVNAQMGWFPTDAQACPLLTFESISMEEDDPKLDKWRNSPHSDITLHQDRICVKMNNWRAMRLDPDYTGKVVFENQEFYNVYDDGLDIPQAEDCEINYEEFLELFNSHLMDMTGITMDDLHIDRVVVTGINYKTKKVNGEIVRGDRYSANAGYHVRAHQLMHGIPVYGAQVDTDKGLLQFGYDREDYWDFAFVAVRETGVLEEDLPLLSFDAFTGELGKLIEAGQIRDVLSMRFGYGTCKDGNTWKTVPMWVVECTHKDDINEGVPHYFNAQTGDMLERYAITARENSLRMPKKILTWDDVN